MTLLQRLLPFLYSTPEPPVLADKPASLFPVPGATRPAIIPQLTTELITPHSPFSNPTEPLPNWLADEENLRDEGVLFGLSDARSEEKVAQIQAFFARQAAPFDEFIDRHTQIIGELNRTIEHYENRSLTLQDQCIGLRNSQLIQNTLIRTVVSLIFSIGMCIGTYFLIDVTLQPVFQNRWIAVGVFLAGMFNLSARTSFFYEEGTRLTGRRILTEVGLPLAASVFVGVQALQTGALGQTIALFVFVFFLFLLAGKLLISNLNALQTDLAVIRTNRRLVQSKVQNLPVWEVDIDRFRREVAAIREQKQSVVAALTHARTELTRLNTHRDWLVNLFVSEFDLARSLRDRLPEQQRIDLLRSYKVV